MNDAGSMGVGVEDALRRADEALERRDRDSFVVALAGVMGDERVWDPLHKVVHGLAYGYDVAVTDSSEDLSPAQAAERLSVSRKLVNKMIDAGTIRCRTKPHSTHKLIPAADVVRLLQERDLFDTLGRVQSEGARATAKKRIGREDLQELIRVAGEPSRAHRSHVDDLVDTFTKPPAHDHLRRGDVDAFLSTTATETT